MSSESPQEDKHLTTKRGHSGKAVTLAVLAGLIIVGGWLSYCLWCYQRIDVTREASQVAWRVLAEKLLTRYSDAEKQIASGVDERSVPMESGEKFQLALDRFRTTVQPDVQQKASREIETIIETLAISPKNDDALSSSLTSFNACVSDEQLAMDKSGSKFLAIFLNFPQPIEVVLAH